MKTVVALTLVVAFAFGAIGASTASAGTKPGVNPCKRGIVYVCQ